MKQYIYRELDNSWYEIFNTVKQEQIERSTDLLYILNRLAFLNNHQPVKPAPQPEVIYEGRRKSKPSLLSQCKAMVNQRIPEPEPDEVRRKLYPDAA